MKDLSVICRDKSSIMYCFIKTGSLESPGLVMRAGLKQNLFMSVTI